MAFCKYCGKKLEDGEVCNCRATAQAPAAEPVKVANPYAAPTPTPAPAPQPTYAPVETPVQNQQSTGNAGSASNTADGNVFAPIIDLVKGTIKNPIKASEEFYEKASIITAGIMVGALALVYMLSRVIPMLIKMLESTAKLSAEGYDAGEIFGIFVKGEAVSYPISTTHFTPYHVITGIFYPILYIALMCGAVVGITFLVDAVLLKRKTDLRKTFALCGATVLPLAAACVLSIAVRAIGWIPAPVGGIGVPFNIVTILCGLLTLLQGLNILNKEIEDRKKLLLTLAIAVAILTLVSWLLCLFMGINTWFNTLPF